METKQRILRKPGRTGDEGYNFEHFTPGILAKDVRRTMRPQGPRPGEMAPDFVLEDTEGRIWQLSDLQGRPVVLILGSASCPMTQGSLPALREVYREFGDRTQWLMLYVREAHPGEHLPAHTSQAQKGENARYFRESEGLPWPVLVDELRGAAHCEYGMLPNPVFLIDSAGRVAFHGDYAHGPTLRSALKHLVGQGDRGVVPEGEDHRLHMLGATAYGWTAIERSGNTAKHDLVAGVPPLAANLWIGSTLRPVLGSVAGRGRPLPAPLKTSIAALIAVGAGAALFSLASKIMGRR